LRVSASRPPLMAATAFVQSTAASPLLAFLRGVQSAGSSLGVLPAISGSLTPPIQDPKLFEIFISSPFFLVFLRRRGQSHRTCGAANNHVHLKDARRGVVDGGGRGGQFSFYLIWLFHGGFWVKK
jgi:hypothetical protein